MLLDHIIHSNGSYSAPSVQCEANYLLNAVMRFRGLEYIRYRTPYSLSFRKIPTLEMDFKALVHNSRPGIV